MICIFFDSHISRTVIKKIQPSEEPSNKNKPKVLCGTPKLFDIFALITLYKK